MVFVALVATAFAVLSISCIFLVRYYKSPSVTLDVTIAVYLSWVLGFSGIILLPFDMAEALLDHEKSPALNEIWHFIYWSTFVLAWGVLPIQTSYHTSGGFTFQAKLWEAFFQNLLFYIVSGIIGVIYIGYRVGTGSASLSEVIGFAMAMGNTYGVLLIIALMGNGLVALPRRLWQLGNTEKELTRLYLLAPNVESAFCDARFELEDCEEEEQRVGREAVGKDKEIEHMAQVIRQRVQSFNYEGRSMSLQYARHGSKDETKQTPVTRKGLVALNKRLIQAQLKVLAGDRRWRILLSRAKILEDLVSGQLAPEDSSWCEMQMAIESQPDTITHSLCGPFSKIHNQLRLSWRRHIFKHVCRIGAVLCAFASAVILWSELVMSTNLNSPIGAILTGIAGTEASRSNSTSNGESFIAQFLIFLALCYMSVCTYWSLFRINIGWAYTLQGPHLSPPSSLIFNAMYFCRLQFSIGYNFLLFVNLTKMRQTSFFSDLVISMEIVPLFGSSFSVYAPIITAIIGGFTLFNGYGRLLKLMGIEHEDAVYSDTLACFKASADTLEDEKREEGRKLVASKLHTTVVSSGGAGRRESNVTRRESAASRRVDDDEDDEPAPPRGLPTVSPMHPSSSDTRPASALRTSGLSNASASTATTRTSGSSSMDIGIIKSKGMLDHPVLPALASRYSKVDQDSSVSSVSSSSSVNDSKIAVKSNLFGDDMGSVGVLNLPPKGKVYGGRYS